MLINRPDSDRRHCYDGGHVYEVAGDLPHEVHRRCGKCGGEDWSWDLPVFVLVCLPHLSAAVYVKHFTGW